jgi:hypothetical protein
MSGGMYGQQPQQRHPADQSGPSLMGGMPQFNMQAMY